MRKSTVDGVLYEDGARGLPGQMYKNEHRFANKYHISRITTDHYKCKWCVYDDRFADGSILVTSAHVFLHQAIQRTRWLANKYPVLGGKRRYWTVGRVDYNDSARRLNDYEATLYITMCEFE